MTRGKGLPYLHNCLVAIFAPSVSASSFAHWIDGCTRRRNVACAKPQSVDAITELNPQAIVIDALEQCVEFVSHSGLAISRRS